MMASGDKRLSINDRHLWALCYSTLTKYGCATMFKHIRPDVTRKRNRQIHFMVPRDHPAAAAVKAYLEDELADEIHAPESLNGEWMWGTIVTIEYFSGVDWYNTAEESLALLRGFINSCNHTFRD